MTQPSPSPEASLIKQRRKAMRPSRSIRSLAKTAGVSEARWRQIEQGYQITGSRRVAAVGRPDTIRRMLAAEGELSRSEMEMLARVRPDVVALPAAREDATPTGSPPMNLDEIVVLLRTMQYLLDQAIRLVEQQSHRDR